MRLIGVLSAYDYDEPPLACMEQVAALCNGFVIIRDQKVTPTVNESIQKWGRHKKCLEIAEADSDYKYQSGRRQMEAMKLVEQHAPDAVLFPDDDEILPPVAKMQEELRRWAIKVETSITIPNLYCWENCDQVVDPRVADLRPHSKILRWNKDELFAKYHGRHWTVVTRRSPKMLSRWPLRHLAFMTPRARKRRQEKIAANVWSPSRQKGYWWDAERFPMPPPTLDYRPNESYDNLVERFIEEYPNNEENKCRFHGFQRG